MTLTLSNHLAADSAYRALRRDVFDGLQDYMIEMFIRTPQHLRQNQQREHEGKL